MEGHDGDWRDCKKCKDSCDEDDYVYFATHKSNIDKLENPPKMPEIKCMDCGIVLDYNYGVKGSDGTQCEPCFFKSEGL